MMEAINQCNNSEVVGVPEGFQKETGQPFVWNNVGSPAQAGD